MEIKGFIGKEVISEKTKRHYVIEKIDGAFIAARTAKQSENGTYAHYRWMTGTAPYDNAIAKGTLVFKDETLTSHLRKRMKNIDIMQEKLTSIFITCQNMINVNEK